MNDRLRVLLIAEACNPTWTSVPLVGYQFARALATRPDLDVTLVSHVNNRTALNADPIRGLCRVEYIDNEWLAAPLYKLTKLLRGGEKLAWTVNTAMAWPAYMQFERQLWQQFRAEFKAGKFELVHRITPLSPTFGSPLPRRLPVPMVLGPLNGGLPWPKEYPELRGREREWLVPLRAQYKRLPYYGSCYRHLAGVISGSQHTATEVPAWYRGRRFLLPENGIDPARFPLADGWTPPTGKFRFLTLGRLVPYKAMDLVVEAVAGSERLRRCQLQILGDGPLAPRVRELIDTHGLSDCVSLDGWVPQEKLSATLQQAQAFVFPSLREFGGGVVLEAMASGLPSIIVNYGGPAELADASCAELLPMQPREGMIVAIRAAMERLADDPARCAAMGAAAVETVRREFLWERKAARVVEFYRELLRPALAVGLPAVR